MKKLIAYTPAFLVALLFSSCNGGGSSTPPPIVLPTGSNVMNFTVGSSSGLCGQKGSVNIPCTSVTVCTAGTTNCQVINDILVDTGSIGLRVFSSALTVGLTPENNASGGAIAECAEFGSGNTWGALMMADVVMGGEAPVTIPIQVINSTYATPPSQCASSYVSPKSAGFNGILGVGLFNEDCGAGCTTNARNGFYFSCVGSTCTGAAVPLAEQAQNPVSYLAQDNNGVMLVVPNVAANGATTLTGALVLGIGTQANNTPSGATLYPANSAGNFTTKFNGNTYPGSFIDSGSNGLFFPGNSSMTVCSSSSNAPGFFCPSSSTTLTATNASSNGNPSVQFPVANANTLIQTGNQVFNDLGANFSGGFDWGIPFFMGKTVYVGIELRTSTLGTGPFWAY